MYFMNIVFGWIFWIIVFKNRSDTLFQDERRDGEDEYNKNHRILNGGCLKRDETGCRIWIETTNKDKLMKRKLKLGVHLRINEIVFK